MKRTIFLFTILLATIPSLSHALINGRWSGVGGATWGPGYNTDCQNINFSFNQGFTTFEIQRADALCNNSVFRFPTGVLTVENGVLKNRGMAVGMIGPDYFHITYSYRPGEWSILDIRIDGKGVMSALHTTSQEGRGTTEIRGTLNPIQ